MILLVKRNGKSLKDSPEIELPDFVVITGENGSGKTQLLESLLPKQTGESKVEPSTLTNNRVQLAEITLATTFDNFPPFEMVSMEKIQKKWEEIYLMNLEFLKFMRNGKSTANNFYPNPHTPESEKLRKILFDIYDKCEKGAPELNLVDIMEHYEFKPDWNLFSNPLSSIFFLYYLHQKESLINYSVSETPPWDIFNNILKEAKFKYRVTQPDMTYPYTLQEFKAELEDEVTGNIVDFESLSSGEKTIMSLFFISYNSEFETRKPQVVLMDEPDNTLHPSFTQKYIDVIQKVFIEKLGIKVIMTTHSPTTVALCPSESIYLMNNEKGYIEHVDKEDAIKSLTYGLTNLTINYKKKVQVFVEADFDQLFYQTLLAMMQNEYFHEQTEIHFISVGDQDGGCDRVKNFTKSFNKAGNLNIAGIIDYDNHNRKGDNNIIILGEQKRYSVENYVFDPLILSVFLFIENQHEKYEINFSSCQTSLQILEFSQEKLQLIVSSFLNKFKKTLLAKTVSHTDPDVQKSIDIIKNVLENDSPDQAQISKTTLLNGKFIMIPTWYTLCNGHHLEEILKVAFPYLQRFARDKEERISLKIAVLNKAFRTCHRLIPIDLLEVLTAISKT